MFKGIKHICIGLVILLLFNSFPVRAAEVTRDLFTLEESLNMAVSILFDVERPMVTFIDPNGDEIEGSSLEYDSGEGWVQYYLFDARRGTWQIRYNQGRNTVLDIHYVSFLDSLVISEFSLETIDNHILQVEFLVESRVDFHYRFEIYAVVLDEVGTIGELLLDSGSARANREVSRTVGTRQLASFPSYHLRLDVWFTHGVEESFDSRISQESFAVENENNQEEPEEFNVEVNLGTGEIRVYWEGVVRNSHTIIGIFDEAIGGSEPFYFIEVIDDRTSITALFDLEIETLRVEFTQRNRGVNTATRNLTIPIQDKGVSFYTDTSELTNQSQILFQYVVPFDMEVTVFANEEYSPIALSGDGSFSVILSEGYNSVAIHYSLADEQVRYILPFTFIVDLVPPLLRLPEHSDILRVNAHRFTIVGLTDVDAVLTINNEEVEVDDFGVFIQTVDLNHGENTILVVATDLAGNRSQQEVIIYRVGGVLGGIIGIDADGENRTFASIVRDFWVLIVTFLLTMIIPLALWLTKKRFEKTENKPLYVLRVLRNLFGVLSVIGILITGYFTWQYIEIRNLIRGVDFFEIAQESITQAYQMINSVDGYRQNMIQSRHVAMVLIGITLLLIALIVLYKKYQSAKPLRQAKKEREKEKVKKVAKAPIEGAFCRHCGTKVKKGNKFCSGCGKSPNQ